MTETICPACCCKISACADCSGALKPKDYTLCSNGKEWRIMDGQREVISGLRTYQEAQYYAEKLRQ